MGNLGSRECSNQNRMGKGPYRKSSWLLKGLLGSLCSLAVVVSLGSAVGADTTYNPPNGTWNGYTIYLSVACHDGNDGIPGGPCIPNTGCTGNSSHALNENTQSRLTAGTTIFGAGTGSNLKQRGYRSIRGNGTVSQNIANSNAAGVDLHIPIHSNAQNSNCTSSASANGTWALYFSSTGEDCSDELVARVGANSPGTNDKTVFRNNLGELTNTNAVACYLEAEFHTWNNGVNWLRNEVNWTWRIGWAVDRHLGYP